MTILEAVRNALEALEVSGFPPGGDVHDDLAIVARKLAREFKDTGAAEL